MAEKADAEPKGGIYIALDDLEEVVTKLADMADSLIAKSSDVMKPQDTATEKAQAPQWPHQSTLFHRIEGERDRIDEVCHRLVDARKRLEL